MTDNEIIIPLKCLVMNESDCSHCKLKDKNDKCQKFLYSDVLGLIDENNRQKAEIEKLNISHFQFISDINAYKEKLKTAKAEAVKEFAEELIYKIVNTIIKEMVGEDKTPSAENNFLYNRFMKKE